MSALSILRGAEAFVGYRLSTMRKRFDKALAKGKDPGQYMACVVPAERAEYLRDELRTAQAALADVLAAANLIVDGAVPATASGHTTFVPRYQIDKLREALSRAGEGA